MGMAIRQEFRNSCRHHENGKVFYFVRIGMEQELLCPVLFLNLNNIILFLFYNI